MQHDTRHGGPYDRGGADFYYGRGFDPHYFTGGTYTSDRVKRDDMTAEELAAYRAGFEAAEAAGDQKDYE
jgi:hypothetical protein